MSKHQQITAINAISANYHRSNGNSRLRELDVVLVLRRLVLRVEQLAVAEGRGRGHHAGGDQVGRACAEADVGRHHGTFAQDGGSGVAGFLVGSNVPATVAKPEVKTQWISEVVSSFRYGFSSRGASL